MTEGCKVIAEVRNGKVVLSACNAGLDDIATISGFLQNFVSYEAYIRGADIESIKDSMLDIHLSAMQAFQERIISERRK